MDERVCRWVSLSVRDAVDAVHVHTRGLYHLDATVVHGPDYERPLMIDTVLCMLLLCFFFFQAEDGIRDDLVTGVQKCALPISVGDIAAEQVRLFLQDLEQTRGCSVVTRNQRLAAIHALARFIGENSPEHIERSEERRVGKECRSRWSPYH